jgi:hypothetical protein
VEKTSEVTFQDMLAVMGPSRSTLDLSPNEFQAILMRIHEQYGIGFEQVQSAYSKLWLSLRLIGGHYRSQTAKVDRKTFIRKLQQLSASSRKTAQLLNEFAGGKKIWEDFVSVHEVRSYPELFLESVPMSREFRDRSFFEVDKNLQGALDQLEKIRRYCDAIWPSIEGLPAKKGQRGLGWYDELVETMVQVATLLGVGTSTDARGSPVAGATPFIALVREVEKLFPAEARSKTASTCARRIERSRKRLRAAQQTRVFEISES